MIKKFGLIAVMQLCNSFAVNILLVMLTALIFKNQGNIAILMILMTIPTILFSSIFGKLIDKNHSKKVLILLLLIALAIISTIVYQKLYTYNWLFYIFAFSVYSTDYFIRLYLQVSATDLTSHQHYLKFNSSLNFIENIGIVIGPILGGILIQKNLLGYGFFVIEIFFISILVAVFFLKGIQPSISTKSNSTDTPNSRNDSLDNTFFKDKLRLLYFIIGIYSFAIGLINVRQISFVITHYHVAEMEYSITESLWGLGMIIGCFTIVILDRKLPTNSLVSKNCFLLGLCVIFLVMTRSYSFALVLFLVLGIGNMILSIGFTTLIQKTSDKKSMGKSLGMKNLWQQIAVLISMGLAGILESSVSSELIYLLAGTLLIIGGLFIFYVWEHWKSV